MTLTLEVYEDDGTTLVGTIAAGQWLEAQASDVMSEPGNHKLRVPLHVNGTDNPAVAMLTADRIVRYIYDGEPIWQGLVWGTDNEPLSPRSHAGETLTINSPGMMAVLDKVRWHPDAGTGNQPFHPTRWLNFAADRLRDDDAAGPQGVWPFATAQLPNYDTDNYFGRPEGFIDTAGPAGTGPQWLWNSDTRTLMAAGGVCYGRQRFTLAEAQTVLVQFAADDEGELWIDDVPVCRIEGIYKGQCVEASLEMSAGEHLIGWWVRNRNALRAGAVYAGWSVDDGMADEVLFRSDASLCRVLGYPAKPPGFTPTEVIRLGVDEANDRGQLPDVDVFCNFISASDTDHQPLQEVTDIAVKAPGDSLLTTVLMLGETYLDLGMSPTGLELNAWIRGTRGNAA